MKIAKIQRRLSCPAGPGAVVICLMLLGLVPGAYGQDHSAAEAGKKLSDPLSDIWALFTEIDYTWSEGDLTDGKWRSGQAVVFQPIMPIPFSENWKLITRPTIPVIVHQDVPDGFSCQFHDCVRGGPDDSEFVPLPGISVNFDNNSGLGDAFVPMMLSPKPEKGDKFGWGLGPTFLFPTATDDQLGTDTWEAGVAGLVTYKTPKLTTFVFPQYWWSYSEDGDAEETSHASILYGAWYNLPNAWQVGIAPTITYNDKADSDNAWNVPVGVMFSKTVKFGKMPVKFQWGAEKSIVRQENYGKDWMIRFNIIPVIPGLFKEPIF